MQCINFFLLAILTFFLTLWSAFFKRSFSLILCGLLSFNSAICQVWKGAGLVNAAVPNVEQVEGSINSNYIAIPPIIREAPIDLQNALAEDFVVARQTPYSSGRNEILITSASTGTEQRFEINLPNTGSFRIYQASFSRVSIADPARVVRDGTSLSSAEIQAKLESFTVNFNDNNVPESVVLADGTKAEFSESETIVYAADGQIIETISLTSAVRSEEQLVTYLKAAEDSNYQQLAQATPSCENSIRDRIYQSAQTAGRQSESLAQAESDEGKVAAWAMTFSKVALEDSLVASSRNQTLQEIACKPPVECNQPQTYNGGSEIRTDLFQLSGGINQEINLEYEFYDIPDRLELYYEGNIIFEIGPASGQAIQRISNIPDGAAYIGIKLVGNQDLNTKWWYTISCLSNNLEDNLEFACARRDENNELLSLSSTYSNSTKDAVPIVFPDYQITVGDVTFNSLGHAGILLINPNTGLTRYYEYGRYDEANRGIVRNRVVPNVVIGDNGHPTEASLRRVLGEISRLAGQGRRILGVYVDNADFDQMEQFVQDRLNQNNSLTNEEYNLLTNNCGHFVQDVLDAGGVDTPSYIDPRPNSYIQELRDEFSPIDYPLR
jgi:hypothetical protein